jgi:hypothetical protein
MRKYKEEILGCLKVIGFIILVGMAEPLAQLLIH